MLHTTFSKGISAARARAPGAPLQVLPLDVSPQGHFASALLAAELSQTGYVKAITIMRPGRGIEVNGERIELDDTQDNVNHIHSVWRDLNSDFGEDLLQQHYETSPHK